MKRTRTLVTEVKRLRSAGLSWANIGRIFGVAEETAHRWGDAGYRRRKRAADRNLARARAESARAERAPPPARYPQETVEEARRIAAEEGLSPYAISLRLRVGISTVRRWLNDEYRRRQNASSIAYQQRVREMTKAERRARHERVVRTVREQVESYGMLEAAE